MEQKKEYRNAFVPTNTKKHPNRNGPGVFFCLLRQLIRENKNPLLKSRTF